MQENIIKTIEHEDGSITTIIKNDNGTYTYRNTIKLYALKKCSKCGEYKVKITEYGKQKTYKDGYRTMCKSCFSEYTKQHYKNNKGYYKDWNNQKKGSFIYVIYEGNKVVYVGSTNGLYLRINNHINGHTNISEYIEQNKWTEIRYIQLDENITKEQRRAVEQVFMNELNPILNKKSAYHSTIDSELYDLGYKYLDKYIENSILYKENRQNKKKLA